MTVINPVSKKIIQATAKSLPQSLLLTGSSGVGLSEISLYIANLINIKPTVILPEKDEKVDIEKGVLGVEIIRKLYDSTKTKSIDKQIFILDFAEKMTTQAQNAFLKLLEEPNDNVFFILVSNSTSKLLPTILSRVETIEIKPITNQQSLKFLDSLDVTDNKVRTQILFMADGLPVEIARLVNDSDYFNTKINMMLDAKSLLNSSLYEKLRIGQKYKDDRSQALDLLLNVTKILQTTISTNAQIDAIKKIDVVLKAYSRIEANGNIRLAIAAMSI